MFCCIWCRRTCLVVWSSDLLGRHWFWSFPWCQCRFCFKAGLPDYPSSRPFCSHGAVAVPPYFHCHRGSCLGVMSHESCAPRMPSTRWNTCQALSCVLPSCIVGVLKFLLIWWVRWFFHGALLTVRRWQSSVVWWLTLLIPFVFN